MFLGLLVYPCMVADAKSCFGQLLGGAYGHGTWVYMFMLIYVDKSCFGQPLGGAYGHGTWVYMCMLI